MDEVTPRQGSFDAFCGIYCAAFLIARHQHGGRPHKADRAFYSLLRSAEMLGLLTADRIALEGPRPGYKDRQIAKVFNAMKSGSRANLIATPFRSARFRELEQTHGRKRLIEQGSSAIVQQNGNDHWIAIFGINDDGGYIHYDPWQIDSVVHRDRIAGKQGVLLTPEELVGQS